MRLPVSHRHAKLIINFYQNSIECRLAGWERRNLITEKQAMNAERIVRSRVARIALAATLIGVSGWVFLPYVTHRVSVSAFVNSELIMVTAPIPGRLAAALPRKGDYLDHATSVALIDALSPDQRRLLDLERQDALAKEARSLAERQLHEIKAIDFELGVRAEAYRLGIVDRLGHESAEAE